MVTSIYNLKCSLKTLGNKFANELAVASKNVVKTSLKINKFKYLVKLLERNNLSDYKFILNNNTFNEDNQTVLKHIKTFPDNSTAIFYGKWIGSFSNNNNLYALATYPSFDFFNVNVPGNTLFDRLALYKLNGTNWELVDVTNQIITFTTLSSISLIFNNGYIFVKTNNILIKIEFNSFDVISTNLNNTSGNYYTLNSVFCLSENNKEIYVKDDNTKFLLVYDYDLLLFKRSINLTDYSYKKIIYSKFDNSLYFLLGTIIYKYDLTTNQESVFKTTVNNFIDLIDGLDKVVVLETKLNTNECESEVFDKIIISFYNKCNQELFKDIDTTDYYYSEVINKVLFFKIDYDKNVILLYNTSVDLLGNKLSFKLIDLNNNKIVFKKKYVYNAFLASGSVDMIINEYQNFNNNKIVCLNGTGGGGLVVNTYSQIISYKLKNCFCKTLTDNELDKILKFSKKVIDN